MNQPPPFVAPDRVRQPGRLLLTLTVLLIAVATLTPGSAERLEPTHLTCLVCGSNGGADVLRNVLLFLPLGAAAALAGVRWRTAVVAGFLLSLTVESMQYFVVVGRDPSLSDLTTNTIGAALGHFLAASWRRWVLPGRRTARQLLAGGTLAWIALLGATAMGLQWDVPPLPYTSSATPPPYAGVREYEGAVYARTLDGRPLGAGDSGSELARAMQAGRVEVGATVGPMYPPGLLRPVIGFYTPGWASVLTFGQQRRDLVLSLRTRSHAARLGGPRWVLHDVFPDLEAAYSPAGQAMRLEIGGQVDGGRVMLSMDDGVTRRSVTLGRRLALGWTFLLPPLALLYRLEPLVSALWLAGPVLVLAYWARRGATGDGRHHVESLLVVVSGTAAVILGVGLAGGLAAPSPTEWIALTTAWLIGWRLATAAPGTGQHGSGHGWGS